MEFTGNAAKAGEITLKKGDLVVLVGFDPTDNVWLLAKIRDDEEAIKAMDNLWSDFEINSARLEHFAFVRQLPADTRG